MFGTRLGLDLKYFGSLTVYQQLQTYITEHPEKQDQDSGMAGAQDVLGLAQMVTKKKRKYSVDCVLEEGSSGMQSAITVEINRSWLRNWIRFRRL